MSPRRTLLYKGKRVHQLSLVSSDLTEMFANCDSHIFNAMAENSTEFWETSNKLSSCSRIILHDPECENQCCIHNSEKSSQSSDYDDLEQLLIDIQQYESVQSISTASTNEKQCLYYRANASKDAEVPAYQEILDYLKMTYPGEQCVRKVESKQIPLDVKHKQTNHGKGIIKRKRKRTVFTTKQIITMEGVFKKRPYVCREERLFLTKKLNVSEKAIKIWFQNRRRITEKRETDQSDSCQSDSTNEELCDVYKTRLDFIETQINENTDEYGFVTLNNRAISELIKIVDKILSYSCDRYNSLHQHDKVSQSEFFSMFEPISPGNVSNESKKTENILKWKPSKPEERRQGKATTY